VSYFICIAKRVVPYVSDLKVLTNKVVFKWQVPPNNHFTKYLSIFPQCLFKPYPECPLLKFIKFVFTDLKVIDRSLLAYFHAYLSVTISKVIGRIYFFSTFAGYYFKGNRQDLLSCIFVGYYFKGNP